MSTILYRGIAAPLAQDMVSGSSCIASDSHTVIRADDV
jgi:hypothetical protein